MSGPFGSGSGGNFTFGKTPATTQAVSLFGTNAPAATTAFGSFVGGKQKKKKKSMKWKIVRKMKRRDEWKRGVKHLTEESEKLKRSSADFEHLLAESISDKKAQEQNLTTTINNLDEEIRKHKEDYANLQKELEAKETEMRNQEDEIKSLKEKNFAQASEIQSFRKNSATDKTAPTLKNTITLNKPRTRSAGTKNAPKTRSTFTPIDDTDDSNLLPPKYQRNPAVKKRVTISPVISSHSLPADNKFDKPVARNLKLKTCYGTRRIKVIPSKLATDKQDSPAVQLCFSRTDEDGVFK